MAIFSSLYSHINLYVELSFSDVYCLLLNSYILMKSNKPHKRIRLTIISELLNDWVYFFIWISDFEDLSGRGYLKFQFHSPPFRCFVFYQSKTSHIAVGLSTVV